jgi:hypothetical protein
VALDRLAIVPDLQEKIADQLRKKVDKKRPREEKKQDESGQLHVEGAVAESLVVEELAATVSNSQPSKSNLCTGILDQGQFGLCTEYALALATSQALQVKYNKWYKAKSILDTWHNTAIPPKAMWPVDCANFVGKFCMHSRTGISHFILDLMPLDTWSKVCKAVSLFAGYRCIVIVAKLSADVGGEQHSTHSMVGVHWNYSDLTIACQNSWGTEAHPFVNVNQESFVEAWLVNPLTIETKVPGDRNAIMDAVVERPSKEWAALCKKLPSK